MEDIGGAWIIVAIYGFSKPGSKKGEPTQPLQESQQPVSQVRVKEWRRARGG